MNRWDNIHFVYGVSCLMAVAVLVAFRLVQRQPSWELLIAAILFGWFGWMNIRLSRP